MQASSHPTGSHLRQPLRRQAHPPQAPDDPTFGDMFFRTAPAGHTSSARLRPHLHSPTMWKAAGSTSTEHIPDTLTYQRSVHMGHRGTNFLFSPVQVSFLNHVFVWLMF